MATFNLVSTFAITHNVRYEATEFSAITTNLALELTTRIC